MVGLVVPAATLTALAVALYLVRLTRGSEPGELFAAIGSAPLLFTLLLRVRLRVTIGPDRIAYRGVLREQEIRVSSVEAAGWAAERALGLGARILHGPLVYQLTSAETSMRINLELFPAECRSDLLAIVPPR